MMMLIYDILDYFRGTFTVSCKSTCVHFVVSRVFSSIKTTFYRNPKVLKPTSLKPHSHFETIKPKPDAPKQRAPSGDTSRGGRPSRLSSNGGRLSPYSDIRVIKLVKDLQGLWDVYVMTDFDRSAPTSGSARKNFNCKEIDWFLLRKSLT